MSDDNEDLFEVENVVDRRIYRGEVQYLVRWSNFSPRHDTWEPEENLLTCHDLIEKYLAEKNAVNQQNGDNDDSSAGLTSSETNDVRLHSNFASTAPTTSHMEDESNLFTNLFDNAAISSVSEMNTSQISEQSEQEQIEEEEKKIRENDDATTSHSKKRKSRQRRWEIVEIKDTFWKQLEKGQVDLSMGLYERVKRKRELAEAAAQSQTKEDSGKRRGRGKKQKTSELEENQKEPEDIYDLTNEQNEIVNDEEINISPNSSSNLKTSQKTLKTYSRKTINKEAELQIDELVNTIVKPNAPKAHERDIQRKHSDGNGFQEENDADSILKADNIDMISPITNGLQLEKSKRTFKPKTKDFYQNLDKVVEDVIGLRQISNENENTILPSVALSTAEKAKLGNQKVKLESSVLHEESNGAATPEPVSTAEEVSIDSFNAAVHLKSKASPVDEKPLITNKADSSANGVTQVDVASDSKHREPLLPPTRGRWLPLVPRLVTINSLELETERVDKLNDDLKDKADDSTIQTLAEAMKADVSTKLTIAETTDSPVLKEAPVDVEMPTDQPSTSNNTADPMDDSDSFKHPPTKSDKPIVTKKHIDDLAIELEEDLNVNDFFKSDMHKCQEDERQSGRFVTDDHFSEACRFGHFDLVRSALTASKNFKCPYDVEAIDMYGNTLLMSATLQKCDPWHSSDDVIEILAQYGANLNACNRAGDTALMQAIEHEHLCKVTKLLSLGAAVNLPNRFGETPLMVACKKGFANVVHRLLEYGADFNATTTNGRTVADMAAPTKTVTKVLQLHESKVKLAFEQELLNVLEPDKMKLKHTLFPMHCYAINESRTFRIMFNYKPYALPAKHFMILVVGIGRFGNHSVSVTFWGSSPVTNVSLNDIEQQPVQEDGRFIFTLCPLKSGANELLLKLADNYKISQCKLLTSAFMVQVV